MNFFSYFPENYSRRVRKSTYKKILAVGTVLSHVDGSMKAHLHNLAFTDGRVVKYIMVEQRLCS